MKVICDVCVFVCTKAAVCFLLHPLSPSVIFSEFTLLLNFSIFIILYANVGSFAVMTYLDMEWCDRVNIAFFCVGSIIILSYM